MLTDQTWHKSIHCTTSTLWQTSPYTYSITYFQYTLTDQSCRKFIHCTTSIHGLTSPDKNHNSLYYQHTLTDQSWHKPPVTVLPAYTDRPGLTQIPIIAPFTLSFRYSQDIQTKLAEMDGQYSRWPFYLCSDSFIFNASIQKTKIQTWNWNWNWDWKMSIKWHLHLLVVCRACRLLV